MRFVLLFLFIFAACDRETPDPPQATSPPTSTAAQIFATGRALQARGLFSQAEQAYRQVLQQAPDNPQYHYYLGVVLHAQSRFAEAQTQFEKALELKPDYAGPRIALGKMFYDVHGKVEEARQLLTEALKLAPNAVEARYILGVIHQREGQLQEAREIFAAIATADSTHLQARLQLGQVDLKLGNYQEAEHQLRQVAHLSPHEPTAFLGIGQALLRMGRAAEGQRALERARILDEQNAQLKPHQDALRQHPDQPQAHSNLAALYSRFGRLKLAVEHYRQSILIDSTYGLGYQGLGTLLQRRGKDDLAAHYYLEALSHDSTLAESHNNLGLILHKQGQLEKALRQYERAVRFAPSTGFYYSNLGNVFLEMDQLDQAQAAVERAIEIDAKLYSAHILLGDIHARRGEFARAISIWENVPSGGAASESLQTKIAEARRQLSAQENASQ
jgi:tetratricopeptide (TPR) repeat protein